MKNLRSRKRQLAFTLVELLVVLAIIALLASLGGPAYSHALARANSLKCATNLRSIGVAVTLACSDNNNTYPEINQTAPPLPYDPSVQGLVGVLGPYGITTNNVQCPTDMANSGTTQCGFKQYGSSYEWSPIPDDNVVGAVAVYPRPGVVFPIPTSKTRLAQDFYNIHGGYGINAVPGQVSGQANVLYADGHVVSH
jgi:prepilin-type N-terminal cleavage/methylation domain-containing protein/prepilin-type processing-associated H-X9-DG protein